MVAMFTPHFNAWRSYDSDGGEAASTALAAQDTAADVDVSSGDKAFQLRARVDETGGASGSTMDDYRIEYEKNDSATWVALSTTDTGDGIRAVAAGLTNDAATTDRSSEPIGNPGSGSFVAGEQSDDAVVDNMQLTANNFTEHVYGVEIVAANVADGDTFDFRFAAASNVTNNVEPRVDVVKSAGATPITATVTAGGTVGVTKKVSKLAAVTAGGTVVRTLKVSKLAAVTAGATVVSSLIQFAAITASVTATATAVVTKKISKSADVTATASAAAVKKISKSATVTATATAVASLLRVTQIAASVTATASVAVTRKISKFATINAGPTIATVKKIGKSAAVTAGATVARVNKISKSASITATASVVASLKQVVQVAASVTAGATVVASNVFIAGGGPGARLVEFVRGVARGMVSGIMRTVFRGRRQ